MFPLTLNNDICYPPGKRMLNILSVSCLILLSFATFTLSSLSSSMTSLISSFTCPMLKVIPFLNCEIKLWQKLSTRRLRVEYFRQVNFLIESWIFGSKQKLEINIWSTPKQTLYSESFNSIYPTSRMVF